MTIIDRAFGEIIDLPCWGVQWEPQLGLSFNFGAPRLLIREPLVSRASSPRVRRLFAHRNVTVRGKWWFWAFTSRWRLTLRDATPITQTASGRRIHESLTWLDGQRLVSARVETDTGTSEFSFDLGAILLIRRSQDVKELWSLYHPNARVLVVRADGYFSHERSTAREQWRPLPSRPAV